MNQLQDASQSKAKVLIVDDDDRLRSLLREILLINGFDVVVAESAEAALATISNSRPDIIVSDVVMPHVDGHKFFDDVKKNDEVAHIPFIFLSAVNDPQSVIRGKEKGCDDYLTKPFDPAELVATINGKLALNGQREAAYNSRLVAHHRRIVNTLSHEFRTPLVAVKTGTELLLENDDSIDEQSVKRLLESIYRGSQRLQRLVDDFMLVQQIDSGYAASVSQKLRKNVSVVLIAETAVACASETLTESAFDHTPEPKILLEFLCGESDSLYTICAYDIQVTNILQRLIANAHKFGGADNLIKVQVRREKDEVVISVIDQGPGLPGHIAKRACGLFEQIDRDKLEQQGCGIGLSIASYFTEINGGTISFGTPLNGIGLEVRVSFPAV